MTLAAVVCASGCGADDPCLRPRTGHETSCAVFDPGSAEWTLSPDQPIRERDTLCAASCIDVPAGFVHVTGSTDLRSLPLLVKLRTVDNLIIDVDGLKDLRGLEGVDITGNLTLATHQSDSVFTSLEGLTDRKLAGLSLSRLMGMRDFDGSRFDSLDVFSVENSGLQRIDVSTPYLRYFDLAGSSDLTSLKLGGRPLEQLTILSTTGLSDFTWEPGLTVRRFHIANNTKLSSCFLEDFFASTTLGPASTRLISNNGPCP